MFVKDGARDHRRFRGRLLIALALVAGLLPFGAVSAHEVPADAPMEPVTFTFTTTEVLEPPQEIVDETGLHLRGEVDREAITGAIEGEAISTFNADWAGPCHPEEMFCEGSFYGWVSTEITTEGGGWDGHLGFVYESFEEPATAQGLLVGRGENAGKVTLIEELTETEEGVTVSGHMLTLGNPAVGVKLNYDVCVTDPSSAAGGFLSTVDSAAGELKDSGAVTAATILVGHPAPGLVFGEITAEGSHGTMNIVFVQKTHNQHSFGHFVILGGTGAYEDLYGYGKTRETIGDDAGCASGAGIRGISIGTGFYN